ncbi:hypothetical protein GCM10009839_18430 [Catenulispora yoronensis]|uniref:NAD(+)--protein-arginine ADP-ribosyltransferase n=2 Tax=Catenulispora yoronensis TaxID=450799 RepID=A0ABN2TUZ9_9ACTN
MQKLGEEAELSARDVRGLAGDPAAMNWIGASGDAFRDSIGKFPGQLDKVATSHQLCATALVDFGNALDSYQSQADRALAQARPLHDQVQRIQNQLSAAHADLTSANKGVDAAHAAATVDPTSVSTAVRAQTNAQNTVSTLNSQMSGTSAQLEALKKLAASAESLRHTAEDTARTKINSATDAGIPPDSFWHKVGEIASVVWKGLVIVAGIVSLIGGIVLLVVGGPLWLIVAVVVAGVILLADKINEYVHGRAQWWEVALAVVACIPITKGLTTLTALGEAFRAGGFLGAGLHLAMAGFGAVKGLCTGMASLVKGGAGKLVRIFSDGSRGAEEASHIPHDPATWQFLDAAHANSAPRIPQDAATWEFLDQAWANSAAPVSDAVSGTASASDVVHVAAPASEEAGHVAAAVPEAAHVGASASDAGHVAGSASDAGHVAASASDAGHVTASASDAGHVAGSASDAGHVAAPASDAGHVTASASDAGHVAASASDAGHVAAPASDAGHVAAPATESAHAPTPATHASDPFGTVVADSGSAAADAADAAHAAAPAADAAHAHSADPFGTVSHTAPAADTAHAADAFQAQHAVDAAHPVDPFHTAFPADTAHVTAPFGDVAHAAPADAVHLPPGSDAAHEAALEGFANKYADFPEDLDFAKEVVANDPAYHGMDPREVAAARGYTGNSFYWQLNGALRDGDPALAARYADHVAAINGGLSKMTPYEGQVIRTMSYLSPEKAADIAAQYVPGSSVVEHAFTSASNVEGGIHPDSLIKMTIQSKTGVDVTAISHHESELEVLFKAGTEFDVLDKVQGPGGVWHIVLQEK